MPKIKKPRVGFKLDMTPMVDVAFLLLTFFMLTTQFRPPEEVQVTLPSSHSAIKLPESNVMTITVAKSGTIYLSVDSQNLRVALFGPAARLKEAIEVKTEDLQNLLVQARVSNPRLRTVIKADKDVEYGPISDVIDILGATKITRFNLVTELERDAGKPAI